ncbi:hypothetical protein LCGC14_0746850 [marine sediment metagenome]|uniref:Uncharacterized protein n=1 Tax=marine sediment metagenome TaxID=412755 RepID=A0A0F9Q9B1_9ZZZZ
MAVVLTSKAIILPDQDVFAPRLGVDSLFRRTGVTVTESAETVGFESENAYAEGFTFDFWRPGVAGINWLRATLPIAYMSNYMGIAAHDLHLNGATIKAQHSTDGGATWTDSSSEYKPGTSEPLMILYDDVFAADHRLWINSPVPVTIGVVNMGQALKFDAPISAPWSPPHLARRNRFMTEVSESGNFLGRVIVADGARLELDVRGIGMGWAREDWEDTVRMLENYPFFFAARDRASMVSEQEVFYGFTEEQPISQYDSNVYGSLALRARGIVT